LVVPLLILLIVPSVAGSNAERRIIVATKIRQPSLQTVLVSVLLRIVIAQAILVIVIVIVNVDQLILLQVFGSLILHTFSDIDEVIISELVEVVAGLLAHFWVQLYLLFQLLHQTSVHVVV
jgi:hypothetical protein